MQRRTCRVPLGLPVLHISSRWRLALFLHASLVESGTEREKNGEREGGRGTQVRRGRIEIIGEGTEPETGIPGTKLLHHSAWSGLRRHCSHDVYVANIRAQFPERCPPRRPFPPLLPPRNSSSSSSSYDHLRPPSRWMHTRRHGPPITKSMAAPDACIG